MVTNTTKTISYDPLDKYIFQTSQMVMFDPMDFNVDHLEKAPAPAQTILWSPNSNFSRKEDDFDVKLSELHHDKAIKEL